MPDDIPKHVYTVKNLGNRASHPGIYWILKGDIINEEDTIGSSFAGEGVETYLVTGIPEGTYSVAFDPGSTSDYDQYTVKNVTVDIGFTTEVEPVSLQLK